eukprot:3204420-Prymnesium_polylepis.1
MTWRLLVCIQWDAWRTVSCCRSVCHISPCARVGGRQSTAAAPAVQCDAAGTGHAQTAQHTHSITACVRRQWARCVRSSGKRGVYAHGASRDTRMWAGGSRRPPGAVPPWAWAVAHT